MKPKRYIGILAVALALIGLGIIWVEGSSQATPKNNKVLEQIQAAEDKNNIFTYAKLLDAVAWNVNSKYVEDINPKDMVFAGIRGMLNTLDPFSVLLEQKAYERLMETTSGKYEGLGMSIDLREGVITVMAPIEGTPAHRKGILGGDKIIEINGTSTKGMTTEEASKLMRGPKGTEVSLKILREGVAEPLEFKIERAVIQLKSVPYAGLLDNQIGYVRLSNFSEDAGKELKNVLQEVKEKGAKGLILDLRSNGGGLLSQAVETSNLFLDKDKLIVYTQGRTPDQDKKFFSRAEPVIPDLPLVILVNEYTASASEIVAGAVQDWDRGIIIGNTTYGKGLVQQIYEMPNDVALKLTTAKYYVPSGRCIQKPEKYRRHFTATGDEDEENSSDTVTNQDDSNLFYTKGGRKVYGGGGIVPDITVEREKLGALVANLENKLLFFDFAVNYTSYHKDLSQNWEVDDGVVKDFKNYLKTKKFTYKTLLEAELDSLEASAKDENKEEFFKPGIEHLRQLINDDKEKEFAEYTDYIKKAVKREVLLKIYGEKGYYEYLILKSDPYVQKAISVLTEKNGYKKLLKG